jgi:hypothetical protein
VHVKEKHIKHTALLSFAPWLEFSSYLRERKRYVESADCQLH